MMESKRKKTGDRVILHCDANSFFASVELVFHPEYKDFPVAVTGNEAERHGIVLAKNPIAARYGIKTAETVFSARKKCPQLITLPPHYEEYARFSRKLNEIYQRYTDQVEPFGIDESWLDVTGSRRLFGTGEEIAEDIRRTVKRELGITVSVGVSFNKVFAKLASDYRKPDAVTVIGREDVERIVFPLPVADLLFVGRQTAAFLEGHGIRTVGELARATPLYLTELLGKVGTQLSIYARGEDDSPVKPYYAEHTPKSVGNGRTFSHDLTTKEEVHAGLFLLADEVGLELRKNARKCRTVALTVKDDALRTLTRQRPVNPPSNLTRVLAASAMEIFSSEWRSGVPVRALTVTAMNLVREDELTEQISFMGDEGGEILKKQEKIEETMDSLRQKYGQSVLRYGTMPGKKIEKRTSQALFDAEKEKETKKNKKNNEKPLQ